MGLDMYLERETYIGGQYHQDTSGVINIKFTDFGGKEKSFNIRGRYNIKDENIIFHVKDTGIGIKDEDKPKIFKRFQRLKEKSKEGYGLGLSISNERLGARSPRRIAPPCLILFFNSSNCNPPKN